MVNKFIDEKTLGGNFKNDIMPNHELGEELRKPIIRKLKKNPKSTVIF